MADHVGLGPASLRRQPPRGDHPRFTNARAAAHHRQPLGDIAWAAAYSARGRHVSHCTKVDPGCGAGAKAAIDALAAAASA